MSLGTGTSIQGVLERGRWCLLSCTDMRITRRIVTKELSYIRNCQSTVEYQSLDINTTEQSILTRIMKVFLSLSLLVALTLAEPPVYRQQSQNERNKYYFARQQQQVETPADAEAAAPYPASGFKPDGPAFELPQRQQQREQAAPQQQYGAPSAPQDQYGAPSAPQRQYGAPQAAPQRQYGVPQAAPQRQYGAPERQYGAPQEQQQYRGFSAFQRQQSSPQTSYGAPTAPQQSYGAPATPQQSYGPPEGVTTTQEPTSVDSEESTTIPSGTESEAEPVNSVNELDEEGEVDEQQRQTGQYYVALPDGRLQRVQYMSSQDIEAMKYFAKIQAENVEPLRGPIYAYSPLQKLQFAPSNLQIAVPDPYATPVVAIRENARISSKTAKAAPEKLQQGQKQQEPLAAEVRYDSPAAIVGLDNNGAPLSTSYSTYTANYQTPNEQRYFITF